MYSGPPSWNEPLRFPDRGHKLVGKALSSDKPLRRQSLLPTPPSPGCPELACPQCPTAWSRARPPRHTEQHTWLFGLEAPHVTKWVPGGLWKAHHIQPVPYLSACPWLCRAQAAPGSRELACNVLALWSLSQFRQVLSHRHFWEDQLTFLAKKLKSPVASTLDAGGQDTDLNEVGDSVFTGQVFPLENLNIVQSQLPVTNFAINTHILRS